VNFCGFLDVSNQVVTYFILNLWALLARLPLTLVYLFYRYLEDEGIFVGEKPVVLSTNVNILENRILHQPDKGQAWFGLDGQIDSLPNPLKQIQTRPWLELEEDIDENIQTYYGKAYVPRNEEKYLEVKCNGNL